MIFPTYEIGDMVMTDFNKTGHFTAPKITDVSTDNMCQTGVSYRVMPPLRNCTSQSWIDEAWFKRIPSLN